jgi:hypothetical protein
MTKEEFKKGLESKIGKMIECGNVATFNAGLKDTPLPEESKSKED